MLQVNSFDIVTEQVIKVCKSLDYSCSFNRESSLLFVYACLDSHGSQVITEALIHSISSITGVQFVSVGIGSNGSLHALFTINEFNDGNTD